MELLQGGSPGALQPPLPPGVMAPPAAPLPGLVGLPGALPGLAAALPGGVPG